VDLKRKLLTCFAVVTCVVGGFAIPGSTAPAKIFSLVAPASVSSATTQIPIKITNEMPNGNSNINSLYITVTGPAAFQITGASPGTAVVSNVGHKVSITGISTIKPTKSTAFTLNVTVPNLACSTSPLAWGGVAYTGNSLSGDKFTLQGSPPSQLATTITEGCTTISVSKYEDTNGNGTQDGEEGPPATAFDFQLWSGESLVETVAATDGSASFEPVLAGTYSVCEVASETWRNTEPGGDACQTVEATGTDTTVTFGNARDVTINVLKFDDLNLNGTIDEGESALQGWGFTLTGDGEPVGTTTGEGGTASFTVPAGTGPYELCETPQEGWLSTTAGADGCVTIPQSETTSGNTIERDFGNVEASGSVDCNAPMVVSGGQPGTTLTGRRIGNVDSSCVPIPYRFIANDQGGFTFFKDAQPDAQFIITQAIELAITTDVSGYPFEANTINGYTTEISYDGGVTYIFVLLCPSVQRDEGGNVIGASLPDGMTTGYCIAEQGAAYGSPADGMVTITTTFYGLGDPITRTRPI